MDTGSVFTLMSQDLYEKACRLGQQSNKLQPFFESVVSANNEPLNILGCVTMEIKIGHNIFKQDILVAKDLAHECLLGTDFLQRNRVTVDFRSMSLVVENSSTALQAHNGNMSVCRVAVAETISIPSRHELVVTAKLQNKGRGFQNSGGVGIFEPKQQRNKASEILVARVIADPVNKKIPIRLINLSSDDIMIYKNTNVGTFTNVEHLEVYAGADVSSPLGATGSSSYGVCATDLGATGGSSQSVAPTRESEKEWIGNMLKDSQVNAKQRQQLANLVLEYENSFSRTAHDLGRTDAVKHRINTGDADPVKQPIRRVPIHIYKGGGKASNR